MKTVIEKPILDMLKKNPNSTIREIARAIGRTPDAVAVAISRMEHADLVTRSGMVGWDRQKINAIDGARIRKPKPAKNWFEGWAGAPKLGL